ncbi:MAG TPA: DUF3857 domain-containing protein [Terracidiphilus sp.]|nr:DUF3857 domain-containing protein [Terracidiphilus sp.]
MRNSVVLRGAVLFCALVSPVIIQAQFQQPSDEELKMTSDPKAPGAAAVYLNIEENDFDKEHSQNYYARIKVLTEKGKEAATVEIRYPAGAFSVGSISGRTIHPDGTIVPLNMKPADLVEVKSKDYRWQRKVFTLPSVEVGSILEYSYQVRYNAQFYWHHSPEWEVQRKYFVHNAHFQFTPLDEDLVNLIWWPNLPRGAGVKKDAGGRFSLDITDVPPAPDEEWMPPIAITLYKVRFYYASRFHSLDVGDYWREGAKDWSKELDKFAEPTKVIRDAVNGLVSPTDSDLAKAQKLYAAVEALDNTNYSRARTESERRELKLKEIKRAEDVWTQKSGNRNEIALLYLAMLRAAGLTAYGMQVVNRDVGRFDPSYMTLWQLDDEVVILSTAGKEIVLDPGEKMCPFLTVSWRHSGAEGLRQSADGPTRGVTPLQDFGANSTRRAGDLTLDDQGGVSGTLQITMTGQQALRWRQEAIESDEAEVRNQFDRELEAIVPQGVEAHVDHFLGLDDPDRILMAVVKVKGTLGSAVGKRLAFPSFFFETHGSEPFVNEEKRLEPVDMQYGEQTAEQLTYHLPAGKMVEGAPQDARISWPAHAVYIAKTKSDPGQIIVARALARVFTDARPDEYPDLRGFYQKVAMADQEQIVLAAAGGGNGN